MAKAIFKDRLFLAGLALRFALIPFFGSHYLRELFVPFLDTAVLNVGTNPWSLSPAHYFPYGTVLFLSLFVPRYLAYLLVGKAALGAGALGLALVKLPLLGFELLLYFTLCRLAAKRSRAILIYFWLNPIAIYITYIHGQLDVASMSLCLLSLYLIIENRVPLSALAMSAAALCKFHVVAAVPLMAFYLWNRFFLRTAVRQIGTWTGVWAATFLVGAIPLFTSGRFSYATTSSPEAFRLFAASLDLGSGQAINFGILLVLAVLGRLCLSTRMSARGLLFGAGVVYGSLLLGTNSMPGWYYWVLPFISLLMVLYLNVPRQLYWAFCALYFIYFGALELIPQFPGSLYAVVAFTCLQTSLAGLLVATWRLVISREAVLQGRTEPVILGVSGNSGAGKDRFTRVLQDIFNPQNTVVVEGDDYHKWERGNQSWAEYTHLHPRANDLAAMASHALELKSGNSVFKSHYDHGAGNFTDPREIKPTKTIILQGLHTLYLKGLREKIDLRIFLAPHESVRLAWKIRRDTLERGHSREAVLKSLKSREADSKLHIAPQSTYADWIIEYFPEEDLNFDIDAIPDDSPLLGDMKLGVRFTFWNDAPIGELFDELEHSTGCQIQFQRSTDQFDRSVVVMRGNPTVEEIRLIASKIFPQLRQTTRGHEEPKWHSGMEGVVQLAAVSLLSGKMMER